MTNVSYNYTYSNSTYPSTYKYYISSEYLGTLNGTRITLTNWSESGNLYF